MFLKFDNKIVAIFAISLLLSCGGNQNNANNKTTGNSPGSGFAPENTEKQISNVKTIFYNIPSPVELAELTQNANLNYNVDLLNSLDKLDQYTSTTSKAMNLGIYGADLSYTRLYDQVQESINYLAAIRKLSESLGVPQDGGAETISRLEENINNKDSLLLIITNIYTNADLYLKENERAGTAALIITGGWIEALHIATNMLDEENPNPEIMERIAEQKYSVDNIIKLLNSNFKSKESLKEILGFFEELKVAFSKVELVLDKGDVQTDAENKVTSINSKTQIYVNFDQIKEIKTINDKLRQFIIS
ncbi:MAG: hypothetical protein GXO79_07340 [Chlorobi bacterium]|nr:hypothetical protein [Chlorobiota bacterium]